MTNNNNIYKSAANIAFFTILSRIFGFIRDIAIAYKLGTGFASDIFFIALKIPNFFRRIFAEGAFSQAFVPLFSEILVSKNQKEAFKFANNIFFYLLASLICLVILFEIFMPYIMAAFAPGYVNIPDKYQELILLSRITFPYIIFISAVSLINGVLNSYKIFIPGALMPIIYNSCLIISLFSLGYIINNNILALSYGLIISGILQLLFILYYARRRKYNLYPKKPTEHSNLLKKFYRKIIPAIFASATIQLNSWVDLIIASLIPSAVSYIYYSERIIQLPLAIIGIALSTALLPSLSQMIKSNKTSEIDQSQKLFNNILNISLFFSLPAMVGVFILNQEIIITLFARGKFDLNSVNATATMLKIYSIAIPAFVFSKILLSNFYARGNTTTPLKISIFTLIINLILNLILIQFFSYKGIAIATVISSWLNIILLYYILYKNKHINSDQHYLKKLLKIIINTAILAIILTYASGFINNYYELTFSAQIILLSLYIAISIIVYLLLNLFIKIYDYREIKNYTKAKPIS